MLTDDSSFYGSHPVVLITKQTTLIQSNTTQYTCIMLHWISVVGMVLQCLCVKVKISDFWIQDIEIKIHCPETNLKVTNFTEDFPLCLWTSNKSLRFRQTQRRFVYSNDDMFWSENTINRPPLQTFSPYNIPWTSIRGVYV